MNLLLDNMLTFNDRAGKELDSVTVPLRNFGHHTIPVDYEPSFDKLTVRRDEYGRYDLSIDMPIRFPTEEELLAALEVAPF